MRGLSENQEEAQGLMSLIFSAKNTTRIATWNICSSYIEGILDKVMREMRAYRIEILGISEMRWAGQGMTVQEGMTILCSGLEDYHCHGVRLMLNAVAAPALIGWKPVNDCFITARLQACHMKVTIVQAYVPTEAATEEDKDEFYCQLQDVISIFSQHDILFLIGDFNAQLAGSQKDMLGLGTYGLSLQTGSNIANDGKVDSDIGSRLTKAAAVYHRLQHVWVSSMIRLHTKLYPYISIVVPTALYGSERWKSTASIIQKLDIFHQRCLCGNPKASWHNKVRNEEVLWRAHQMPRSEQVKYWCLCSQLNVKVQWCMIVSFGDQSAKAEKSWHHVLAPYGLKLVCF